MTTPKQPFESAASGLVAESQHPLLQLRQLDVKVEELRKIGDIEAVVECRIKQVALHKVLHHLNQFPVSDLIYAHLALAEAYAEGAFCKQAGDHLEQAKTIAIGAFLVDSDKDAVKASIQLVDATLQLANGALGRAKKCCDIAESLVLKAFGRDSIQDAQLRQIAGQVAYIEEDYQTAAMNFSTVTRIREKLDGPDKVSDDTICWRLRFAEMLAANEQRSEAIEEQEKAVQALRHTPHLVSLYLEASCRLAEWLEREGPSEDGRALAILQEADVVATAADANADEAANALATAQADLVTANQEGNPQRYDEALKNVQNLEFEAAKVQRLRPEAGRMVELQRDIGLLHLKLRNIDLGLETLSRVEYLERRLHGSRSLQVARTLKAIGTIHMEVGAFGLAKDYLLRSLDIFLILPDPAQSRDTIRDIRLKLGQLPPS